MDSINYKGGLDSFYKRKIIVSQIPITVIHSLLKLDLTLRVLENMSYQQVSIM